MTQPRVITLTGHGINCEKETNHAFERAGAKGEIIHVDTLIRQPKKLLDYQILALAGGFSYGDYTGAGNALAKRIKNHLWDELMEFIERGSLILGICNGFQILVNLGILPAIGKKYGDVKVALGHNDSARYSARWVDVKFQGNSPWVQNNSEISMPIAHGEGKFLTDKDTLQALNDKKLVAARYVSGNICKEQELKANPNGSLENIAGITDETGRVMGMMPHPERTIKFTQLPHWTLLAERYKREGKELPKEADGLQIFRNGVEYFR